MLRRFLSLMLVLSLAAPVLAGSHPDFPTLVNQLVGLVNHPRPDVSGEITAIDKGLVVLPCLEKGNVVYICFTQYGASGLRINREVTADGQKWRRYAERWSLDNHKLPKNVWMLSWTPVATGQPPAFGAITVTDKAWATQLIAKAIRLRQSQGNPSPPIDGLLVYAPGKRSEARAVWRQYHGDEAQVEEAELAENKVRDRVSRHVLVKPFPIVLAVGYKNLAK